jgi:hypothetical protein
MKRMLASKKIEPGFAVCLKNEGYAASLERHKIYRILPDPEAEKDGDLRIIDDISISIDERPRTMLIYLYYYETVDNLNPFSSLFLAIYQTNQVAKQLTANQQI